MVAGFFRLTCKPASTPVHPLGCQLGCQTHPLLSSRPVTILVAVTVDLVRQVLDVGSWQPLASCSDPELAKDANWFPDQHHARDHATEKAMSVCSSCPVRVECLMFSLLMDRHKDRGIFGGMSPRQRNKLRGSLARAGLPIAMRLCAVCGRRFAATPTTPREKVCCSPACSSVRRRRTENQTRWERGYRARLEGVVPLPGRVDDSVGPVGSVPPALREMS